MNSIWLKGLISGALGAGITAVASVLTNPQQSHNYTNIISVAIVAALLSIANYLKQSPLKK